MTESQKSFEKDPFSSEAVAAFQKGELLGWLCTNRFLRTHGDYKQICETLTELHNSGEIDLVVSMQNVSKTQIRDHDFWQLQSLFSELIPNLETQANALMEGVMCLVEKGGQDLMANQPNAAFREWLKRRPDDTRRLLEKAQQTDAPSLKLLTFVLEAGVTQDFQTFFNAAINFLSSEHVEDRLAAVTALSRIDLSSEEQNYERCLDALLSHAAKAADIQEVAQTIGAILDVHAQRPENECERIVATIEQLSRQPTPDLHYMMARSLGHDASKFSDALKVAIIKALETADPSFKGVIDQIDFAFSQCINVETRVAIADCLETLLAHPDSPLNFDDLDGLNHSLGDSHSDDLAWLVIHWLRNGSHQARLCLPSLFRRFSEDGFALNLSLADFKFSDQELVFVSKKALGYLLLQPSTAASILISCLRAARSENAATEISDLLFDPLMINFSGQAREVVLAQFKAKGTNNKFLKQALDAHENYLDGLRKTTKVPELRPSASARQVQAERRRQLSAQIFKDAEKHSVLLGLVTRQTLLHGTGSVYYIRAADGSLKRSETHLASHGTSFEFPRFEAINPVYLQNIIFQFRNEKFQ